MTMLMVLMNMVGDCGHVMMHDRGGGGGDGRW